MSVHPTSPRLRAGQLLRSRLQGYEEGVLAGLRLALNSYRRLRRKPQMLDYEDLLRAAIKHRSYLDPAPGAARRWHSDARAALAAHEEAKRG